jgi:hypothetical protein
MPVLNPKVLDQLMELENSRDRIIEEMELLGWSYGELEFQYIEYLPLSDLCTLITFRVDSDHFPCRLHNNKGQFFLLTPSGIVQHCISCHTTTGMLDRDKMPRIKEEVISKQDALWLIETGQIKQKIPIGLSDYKKQRKRKAIIW